MLYYIILYKIRILPDGLKFGEIAIVNGGELRKRLKSTPGYDAKK